MRYFNFLKICCLNIFFLFNHTLVILVSYNFSVYVLLNYSILGLLYFSDIKGNNVPQRAVYPTEIFDFPRKWLGKSYTGSKDYYEKSEIVENQPNKNKDDQ